MVGWDAPWSDIDRRAIQETGRVINDGLIKE